MAEYHSSAEEEEEEEDRKDDDKSPKTPKSIKTTINKADGSGTIPTTTANTTPEVANKRKPRGRPRGSKNKPKPPIVITRENNTNESSSMQPMVLEVSAGAEVVCTLTHFARRRHVSLCLLTGSGTVANVTLRHPSSHNATLTFPGHFHILSFSGSLLSSSSSFCSSSLASSSSSSSSCGPLSISLSGAQGQVIGGTVAGKLVAVSNVVLVAASFVNPSFHRLPSVHESLEDHHQHQDQADHDHHHQYQDVKPNNKANITSGASNVGMSSSHDQISCSSIIYGSSSSLVTITSTNTSTGSTAPLIIPLSCQNVNNPSGSAVEHRVFPWPPSSSSSSRPPHHDPY